MHACIGDVKMLLHLFSHFVIPLISVANSETIIGINAMQNLPLQWWMASLAKGGFSCGVYVITLNEPSYTKGDLSMSAISWLRFL